MSSALNVDVTRKLVEQFWDDSSSSSASSSSTSSSSTSSSTAGILSTLCDYIRIPNSSPQFDPHVFTNGYQEQAVELLSNWAKRQPVKGMQVKTLSEKDRTPCIFITVDATPSTGAAEEPSVLMYGHLDKQPPLTSEWTNGLSPYTPIIREGKLYGRGGADDGYAIFAAVSSIAVLQSQNVPHARIVMLIEACEESGSRDLLHYLDLVAEEIGNPSLVVCLDSGCGDYEHMWLTSSLRGMLLSSLRVKILHEAAHSGNAAGIVPSSFRILRNVLDRIEDSSTGKLPDFMFVTIPKEQEEHAEGVAATVGDLVYKKFTWVNGAKPDEPIDLKELILNQTWRPALSVTGIDGIPSLVDAGNVLRSKTHAKLSIRLPPTSDPEAIGLRLKEILEKDPPYGAEIEYTIDKAQAGWLMPPLEPWLSESLSKASEQYFKKPVRITGEGGSIPFMKMLGDKYPKTSFVIAGVLGPGSNAHGPNEFLHIEMAKKLTCTVAAIVADHYHVKHIHNKTTKN